MDTLDQWVDKLPTDHPARAELAALSAASVVWHKGTEPPDSDRYVLGMYGTFPAIVRFVADGWLRGDGAGSCNAPKRWTDVPAPPTPTPAPGERHNG